LDGGLSGFAFHAAPPPGHWFNDPNGLCFRDGRYRLYVQHAQDAPDFSRIGWGELSSPDLLQWTWQSVAIAPDETGFAYSGSLIDATMAALTRHDPAGPCQSQHLRRLREDRDSAAFGPQGPACRDPFLFRWNGGWAMLVAGPCRWNDWPDDPPSRIEVWNSPDLVRWERTGEIGPWDRPGILWEVPVLLDFGEVQALILSLVDRRFGRAACSVRYWLGRFDGRGFDPDSGFPELGLPLDLGPDFYAVCPNLEAGWPDASRVIVGWASSWNSARSLALPGNAHGGPISLPRQLRLDPGRLRLRPLPAALSYARWSSGKVGPDFALDLTRGSNRIELTVQGPHLSAERALAPPLDWSSEQPLDSADARSLVLFSDGPLLEFFIEPDGAVFTAMLPGDEPLAIDFRPR
jgi:sucrose-6-phosphate hydrolase SacC (GH32 family)